MRATRGGLGFRDVIVIFDLSRAFEFGLLRVFGLRKSVAFMPRDAEPILRLGVDFAKLRVVFKCRT